MKPGTTNPDNTLHEHVRSLLLESNQRFVERFKPRLFEVEAQGRTGIIPIYITVLDTTEEVVVHSVTPFIAPPDTYGRTAEFLARANHGLSQGTFELNFESGQLRFRTSIYVDGDQLSFRVFKKLVWTNVMLMDKYLPALRGVVLYGHTAQVAIAQAERKTGERPIAV